MFRRIYHIVSLLVLLLSAQGLFAQSPQAETRIEGLEHNEEYMKLLREDARLQEMEQAVVASVERAREQLRADPANRQTYSQQILELENKIFEIRNAKGRLIDRINTIEQEWVLANLNGAVVTPPVEAAQGVRAVADSLKVRNLVDNLYFRETLLAEDYTALREAQRLEPLAEEYAARFRANHRTLVELAETYESTHSEAEAVELYDRYTTIQGLNRVLADSLSMTWNAVFDNKSYAYAYLLDLMNEQALLTQDEERLAESARRLSSMRDQTASDAMADYFVRRKALLENELSVANRLELGAARDSLRFVAAQLNEQAYLLPKVTVSERYFLVYDSISFSTTTPYTTQNPIPECRIYAKGTIYRILLGAFNTKRAASTFREVYPLSYLVNDENKWCYFAGGFATLAQAEATLPLLKKRGFIRPEIAVWVDGVYRNLTRDPDTTQAAYRVEITGAEALPDAVKLAIESVAGEVGLSRVGQQLFVVGPIAERSVADRVASAAQQADGALEIKVTEIAK